MVKMTADEIAGASTADFREIGFCCGPCFMSCRFAPSATSILAVTMK